LPLGQKKLQEVAGEPVANMQLIFASSNRHPKTQFPPSSVLLTYDLLLIGLLLMLLRLRLVHISRHAQQPQQCAKAHAVSGATGHPLSIVICRCGGQFSNGFLGTWDWDQPGHKPDSSLEKYKTAIKLLVAATAGCQGTKN
jgi:hypothetical protein